MNEENALSQLKLTEANSQARRLQLMALDEAVLRLDCQGSTAEVRTLAAIAIFLVYLGRRVEALVTEELRLAHREIEAMKQLPDEAQWEYRCASTLGVTEGINRIASVQAKIIEQAQSSLHKASIILMATSGNTALPATIKDDSDKSKSQSILSSNQLYLVTILQELNPKQDKRCAVANKMAVNLSKAYLQKAVKAQNSTDLSLSSICTSAIEFVEANILASLSAFAMEAVEFGSYLDDPARGAKGPEYNLARLISAGIVSVFVTDLIKVASPWVSVNLN